MNTEKLYSRKKHSKLVSFFLKAYSPLFTHKMCFKSKAYYRLFFKFYPLFFGIPSKKSKVTYFPKKAHGLWFFGKVKLGFVWVPDPVINRYTGADWEIIFFESFGYRGPVNSKKRPDSAPALREFSRFPETSIVYQPKTYDLWFILQDTCPFDSWK